MLLRSLNYIDRSINDEMVLQREAGLEVARGGKEEQGKQGGFSGGRIFTALTSCFPVWFASLCTHSPGSRFCIVSSSLCLINLK